MSYTSIINNYYNIYDNTLVQSDQSCKTCHFPSFFSCFYSPTLISTSSIKSRV